VLVEGLPAKAFLNVNVPAAPPRGLRMTQLGHRVYTEKIVEQRDPRGRIHYWLGGGEPKWEVLEGTDMAAIHDDYVSVSPLHLDLTHHRALAHLTDWAGPLSSQLRRASRRAP